jgi:DNA polymerase III subunit delta
MKRPASPDALKSQADFDRKLKGGEVAPLYLLEGEETYLREQALRRLIEVAVDESVRDFNVATVSAAKGSLDEALMVARQFPMISPRRVVVVTDFESINDERQLETLKDYLRQPAETTALVFVSAGLDNRRNIATMLRKSCEVVSFAPLDEREAAPRWVADYVARAGAYIDPSAASYLVGLVGTDLRRLANELDKLINYLGGGEGRARITQAEIDELVQYSHERSNFELTDALLDGNRRRALQLLDQIFETSDERPETLSLMLLGAVASNYRRMLLAKELMAQNAPNSEVAKAVGMPPFAVTRFNEKVRRAPTELIVRAIERIAAADVALKSSLATPRLQIEMLVCELCPASASSPSGARERSWQGR